MPVLRKFDLQTKFCKFHRLYLPDSMKQSFSGLLPLLLLLLFSPAHSQVKTIIYDGFSGVEHCHILNDSILIMEVVKKSPARKAGIKNHDRIISINGIPVSGRGLQLKEVHDLLVDVPGTMLHLEVAREGVDSVMHFSLERIASNAHRFWLDYEYLVDSTNNFTIEEILEDSLQQAFLPIQKAKLIIESVPEDSRAAKAGMQAGDLAISLAEAVDNHDFINVDHNYLANATEDTLVEVIRDSLRLILDLDPHEKGALEGLTSRFGVDYKEACIWIKFRMEGRITEDRSYLAQITSMADSIIMYEPGTIFGTSTRVSSVAFAR